MKRRKTALYTQIQYYIYILYSYIYYVLTAVAERVMSATTDTILNSGARETMVNLENMKMKTLGALSKSM